MSKNIISEDKTTNPNIIQIVFSPIITLWEMAKSKGEVESEELNLESSDKTERLLAESQESINERVNRYGSSSSKAQRSEMMKKVAVKVQKKNLAKESQQESQQVNRVEERDQDQR